MAPQVPHHPDDVGDLAHSSVGYFAGLGGERSSKGPELPEAIQPELGRFPPHAAERGVCWRLDGSWCGGGRMPVELADGGDVGVIEA